MPINKLEQLRKYIFNIEIESIEFERIQFEQVSNPKGKLNLLEFIKLFRYKVYHPGINCLYDSLIERNKKRYVAAVLKLKG